MNRLMYADLEQRTDHYKVLRSSINKLMNTQANVVVVPYPEHEEDYLEPTYGQCVALQDKGKTIILQQKDGSYVAPVAGDNRKIHYCRAQGDDVEAFIARLTYSVRVKLVSDGETIFEFERCQEDFKQALMRRLGNTDFKLSAEAKQAIYNFEGSISSTIAFINTHLQGAQILIVSGGNNYGTQKM